MIQVQDIYRRDFSSHFRAHFIKDRALCDKIKAHYSLNGEKKSEHQLKYMLLEWGRDFKKMYIDAPDSHTLDIAKEAQNYVNAKIVTAVLTRK